jgi:ArsR family metal-binding transcriptional regulator
VSQATCCARCGEQGMTVVIKFSAATTYLDLCEKHLSDLLQGARSADESTGRERLRSQRLHETRTLS